MTKRPVLAVLAAIAITTTMDANGLTAFSALALFPLMIIFWWLDRLPRRSVGFTWGKRRDYGLALLYPLAVIGAVTIVAITAGAADLAQTDWGTAMMNLGLIGASTVFGALITEEGFFRGWLWASLEKRGMRPTGVLLFTSIAFSLWHLSAVSLDTGFDLPPAQIPVYMVNAVVMGLGWGLLRWISGSIVVASVSHGVWNGIAYSLFGFGTKAGALGVTNRGIYGPEVGIVGLAINVIFVALLWRWWRARSIAATSS